MTQGQHELVWEVETYSERHNAGLWETQSELSSFEVDLINEEHENLTQELVAPLNELTQCVDEVELFSQTKSFIDVEIIDILGVENFNWVMNPYFVQLINKLKTTSIKNGLVVEYKCLRRRKHKKYSKYLIRWDGRI